MSNYPNILHVNKKKIAGLLEKGVFKFVISKKISSNIQIFHFHFENKIKNLDTDKTYEKSQLLVQAYNDKNKNFIFIQLLTIQ